MHVTLDGLPFDVVFNVVSTLNFEDVLNLSDTCRQLRSLLRGELVSRRIVEVTLAPCLQIDVLTI